MDFLDIVKKAGVEIFTDAIPMGGTILKVINGMLPDDSKLPLDATGKQIEEAVKTMPPELRQKIELKSFDVEMTNIKESHETARQMLISDAINPHSTRAKTAYQAFLLVALISMTIVLGWLYAVLTSNPELTSAIMNGWVFVGAVIAPFVVWIDRYFGILRKERESKLNAANGFNAKSDKSTLNLFSDKSK